MEATAEKMQRFNRLFSEALLACLHQHLRCYAIAQIALRNLAYFPGCMNQACLSNSEKLHLPQSGVATHVEERDVDDTSSSKQNIELTDNLENWRKELFISAVLHCAEYVMSYIQFSVFTSSDYSELIYRVPTRLR